MGQENKLRVVVADDHEAALRALERLLRPQCEIVGSFGDGNSLLQALGRLNPDVVVMDINMPGVNGLDACQVIKQSSPQIRVVLVTASSDSALRQQAFAAGASAFVPKYLAARELLAAVQPQTHS